MLVGAVDPAWFLRDLPVEEKVAGIVVKRRHLQGRVAGIIAENPVAGLVNLRVPVLLPEQWVPRRIRDDIAYEIELVERRVDEPGVEQHLFLFFVDINLALAEKLEIGVFQIIFQNWMGDLGLKIGEAPVFIQRLLRQAAQQQQTATQQNTIVADTPSETETPTDYHLSLRANLLRWATLTPDLGLEWHICPSWGIAVNGSWTSWSWSDKDRRYALWEVAPEVRYYMGEKKAWYLGAMFKAGQFNYKLSDTGKQGDLMGGGITAGYRLRLNKALALDFNLGLGYLNADYEEYEVINGVRVRRGNETKDWWGPINAGVTLVWKLF